MNRIIGCLALLTFAVVPLAAEETGTLRMQFVYDGEVPKRPALDINKDQAFCGKHDLKNESLIVNPTNKGIKNVVLFIKTGRRGTELPEYEPVNKTHVLANENCRFEPRIVIARVGDTLKVTNPDEVGHNANVSFFRNDPANPMIPVGGEHLIELKQPEPSAMPITCNIHPWMKAFLVVTEHPFAAVSDDDGVIEIEGLPVGTKLMFQLNHEAGKIDEVEVNGKKEKWRGQRFEVEIEPGMNDWGKVTVPEDALDVQ